LVNKVTVIRYLLDKVMPDPDFILCIGSDKYDEAMFEFLKTDFENYYLENMAMSLSSLTDDDSHPNSMKNNKMKPKLPLVCTIGVGSKQLSAQHSLANVPKVLELLTELASNHS